MLEKTFVEVYTKFKLNFYRGIFARLNERESSLSASEAFAVEVIFGLGEPTISQFADFLQISLPNATYKVNALVKKGYIEKVKSSIDRREYHLRITEKFKDYYAINQNYITTVMERIELRFNKEDTNKLIEILSTISRELMPESNDKL